MEHIKAWNFANICHLLKAIGHTFWDKVCHLALITSYPESQVVSGCVFSILFPLFLVSANQGQVTATFQDVTIKIFNPTILLSNMIFSRSLAASNNITTANS